MKRIVSALLGFSLAAAAVSPVSAQTYPLPGNPTLSYWMTAGPQWQNRYKTLAEAPFGKGLMDKTGVNLKYIVAAANQGKEALNLMLASGDMADMVEAGWLTMPGGPDKYVTDGYILRLNDYLAKWAPNLTAYLKSHPDIDKMIKTDAGNYYCFPFIRGGQHLAVFQGPIVRKDWLDDLGLKVPVTIDDWTKVLTAFKDKKHASAPFAMSPYTNWGPGFGSYASPAFSGAFGSYKDWYVNAGKVVYGPYQPQYRKFVEQFADWYKKGLLDPNIALADKKSVDALFSSGQAGASVGNTAGGIGYLNSLVRKTDPKADFVAAPYPVLKKGDRPQFGQMDLLYGGQLGVAVSAKLAADPKKLEAAIRFLDWGYSAEGGLYYNFGTPGVSYNLVNGAPQYTALVLKNPTLSPAYAIADYARGSYNGPFIQDPRYIDQIAGTPEELASVDIWADTDMAKYKMPNITPNPDDVSKLSQIMSEVNTYVAETFVKMVIGAQPTSDFDKYIATLKQLGIDQAIAIEQKGYDAYQKR